MTTEAEIIGQTWKERTGLFQSTDPILTTVCIQITDPVLTTAITNLQGITGTIQTGKWTIELLVVGQDLHWTRGLLMILDHLWVVDHLLNVLRIIKVLLNIYGAAAKHNTWTPVLDISHIP